MTYITPINFQNGQTIAERIFSDFSNGHLIPNQKSQLSLRQLWVNDPTGTSIPTDLVSTEMNHDFTTRFARCDELFGPRMDLETYSLPMDTKDFADSMLPKFIKDIATNYTLQKFSNGEHCNPHRDHTRLSSLFYLFTEESFVTTWWETDNSFKEYRELQYADPDGLIPMHYEIIKKDQWYLIDQATYHSCHRLPMSTGARINLVIEFAEHSINQLLDIFNAHS